MEFINKGGKEFIQIERMELNSLIKYVLWSVKDMDIDEYNCGSLTNSITEAIFEITEKDPEVFNSKVMELSRTKGVIFHKE